MLKFSRSLAHRTQFAGKFLPGKAGDVKDANCLSNFTSRFHFSTGGSGVMYNEEGNPSERTYAPYSIFKGKAALIATPVPPKFIKIDSVCSRVEKNGVVLLKFMPAVGQRKYDYEKKQLFALSPTEVGNLISLGPTESCEFFHDPSKMSHMEGQIKKTLTVSPINDGSGYFFNLGVTNSVQKTTERMSVPVTRAEFTVMRTAFVFALPHLMGWDRTVASQFESSAASSGQLKQPEMRLSSSSAASSGQLKPPEMRHSSSSAASPGRLRQPEMRLSSSSAVSPGHLKQPEMRIASNSEWDR